MNPEKPALALCLALLSSCAATQGGITPAIRTAVETTVRPQITCSVFVRKPSLVHHQNLGMLRFTETKAATISSDSMTFEAQFFNDRYEGINLVTSVTEKKTRKVIERTAYEFGGIMTKNSDSASRPFTGRRSVWSSSSDEELEYSCTSSS